MLLGIPQPYTHASGTALSNSTGGESFKSCTVTNMSDSCGVGGARPKRHSVGLVDSRSVLTRSGKRMNLRKKCGVWKSNVVLRMPCDYEGTRLFFQDGRTDNEPQSP